MLYILSCHQALLYELIMLWWRNIVLNIDSVNGLVSSATEQ